MTGVRSSVSYVPSADSPRLSLELVRAVNGFETLTIRVEVVAESSVRARHSMAWLLQRSQELSKETQRSVAVK